MTYKGETFYAVKADGNQAYAGPIKRARIWAEVFGGHVEDSTGRVVK
jgi:hypothetical protein